MAKKSKGLGDTIAKVTEVTGMDKVAKFILGEDCGCDERRKKLNRQYPNFKNLECLNENEYEYLATYFSNNSEQPSTKIKVITIYNRVFSDNITLGSCSQCFPDVKQNLKYVFDSYGK
tara:strand:+ start:458 stop:811 length:354 start_codon:yes stop_codon:yes gene_type:complete